MKQQLYIQLFSNIVIPVLGFLWWGWGLYFILLFYMLDILSAEIVTYLKSKKIKDFRKNLPTIALPIKVYQIISFLFLVMIIVEMNIGMLLFNSSIDLKKEFVAFLMYKEIGIPQFVILIPLVVMMAYSSYKVDFLIPKHYLHMTEKTMWKNHIKNHFLLLSFCSILTLISVAFHFSEGLVLSIIILVTTIYNYIQGSQKIGASQNYSKN